MDIHRRIVVFCISIPGVGRIGLASPQRHPEDAHRTGGWPCHANNSVTQVPCSHACVGMSMISGRKEASSVEGHGYASVGIRRLTPSPSATTLYRSAAAPARSPRGRGNWTTPNPRNAPPNPAARDWRGGSRSSPTPWPASIGSGHTRRRAARSAGIPCRWAGETIKGVSHGSHN